MRQLVHSCRPVYVGGPVEDLQHPFDYDFARLRHTPAEMRDQFAKLGRRRIVAFQTRSPMHRAHVEVTMRVVAEPEANLLDHPVVRITKPGDIDHALMVKLLEIRGRPVTLLHGDIVRKNLSSELRFSKEHRDLNIERIGFVASEVTKNGGIAICALITPYASVRQRNRELISGVDGYILVWVNTPLEVCEERDRKGLYTKARTGILADFTGVSDPYEEPADADVVINTTLISPYEVVNQIIPHLEHLGYIGTS